LNVNFVTPQKKPGAYKKAGNFFEVTGFLNELLLTSSNKQIIFF